MIKRGIALLLALCLIYSAAPVYAGAASGQKVSANAVTVMAGHTAYVTLKAENFQNIAALDVYVYYDAGVFTVSGTSNGSMLSGAQASVNTAEAGTIKLSAMALNGINGTGTLLKVYFETAVNCTPGTYPITVAIGRAHDGNLAQASIQSANGSVTVNKPVATESFYLYDVVNTDYLKKEDILAYQLYSQYQSFVSGEFTVEYDHELFAFDAIELDAALTGEGAVYSVNSSVLGQVRIAYANDTAVSAYRLFTVKLKVIGDVDTTSTVKATANNMYRADLSAYLPGSWSRSVTLQKQQINDDPDAFLRMEQLIVGQQSGSVFCLEAGTGIAAADFTVTYDPATLRCVDVKVCEGLEAVGGMVVINDNYQNGAIRFSYINMDAYSEAELPIVKITWEPLCSPDDHYQITLGGVGVVDTEQEPIALEYVTDSGCIFIRTVVPPTCLLDGYTDHTCACGENFQTDPTEKLGHDIHQFPAQAVTCTQIGWDAYEGCSRCDYTTYVEIPALGHDEIVHEAQVQTCLDIGWDTYVTCSRCDYSTYEELPALGHRVIVSSREQAEPLSVENNEEIPFSFENGTYYSNNHTDYSSSQIYITAIYDCVLTLNYGVSSESGFDNLSIFYNGMLQGNISGIVTDQEMTLQLFTGDQVTVRYSKDSSASANEDRGWVTLHYDPVWIGEDIIVPAHTLEPDCTNAVICSYCQTEIKAALGHDYRAGFTWNAAHSACRAEISCNRDCGWQTMVDCTVTEDRSDPVKTVHNATILYDGTQFSNRLVCDNYLVRFVNWDGSVISETYYHLEDKVQIPADPTKAADDKYTYTFAGWDKAVVDCAGHTTYTAMYTPSYIDYTVTFLNADGAILSQNTYHWGDAVQIPAAPSKEADGKYTYTFAGWDKEVINCAGNATYTAMYTPSYIDYTVIFLNADGAMLSQKTYHWDDTVEIPETPTKLADERYHYVFSGWDKEVTACQGDAVYTATYAPVYNAYTVKFFNEDVTLLSENTYHWGDPVEIPENPTKSADNTYIYPFAGWDKEVTVCQGNAVYTATYAPVYIDYTVTFVDEDGTVISEKTYHWGDAVEIPESPTKAADNIYIYPFAGWDKEVINCAGNATYMATYAPVYIDYTVTFVDADGTVLSTKTYHWGDPVEIPENPTKAADDIYTYTFAGWDKEIVNCAGDATYTATYASEYIDYTVTFVNEDGTVLSAKTYHWGDSVEIPEDPAKAADNTYTYTFAGWDQEVVNCAGNAIYTATYTPIYIDYTVTFVDEDGTVLSTKTYHWGDRVTAPADPSKAADKTYTYTFAGWDKEVTGCAGNAVYTATYTPVYIDYTVVFQNWDKTELSKKTYHYGDVITAPADPAKAADNTYTYAFSGWDKELICAGNMTITAVYTPVYIDYTVVFQNWNKTELSKKTYHYGDVITAPEDPAKAADNTYTYTFVGWDKEVVNCAGNAIYTATYTPVYIDYTVTFADEDGTVHSAKTYHWGDPVETPEDPSKAADHTYTYTFAGWDKEVTVCAGNATYTATYKAVYIDYTVTFQYADGTVISSNTYHYGDTVIVPEDPAVPEALGSEYVFKGWDKEVADCTANAVYAAVFRLLYPLGDFNKDYVVTNEDVIYLLWHTLFPESYPIDTLADFNHDDLVTNEDVIYLLWHTLFPESYPLTEK